MFAAKGPPWRWVFSPAAEQGHAQAQAYLGRSLLAGEGTERDHVEAVIWFRQAAEQA
jgi:uncharacterized protein